MKKPKYRDQYDEERDQREGDLAASAPQGISLTEQSHTDDANLSLQMQRMGVKDGSILPAELSVTDPRFYGDMDENIDLRTALDRTREAQERFNALPAHIRRKFDNDPKKLLDYIHNDKNTDEAVQLGLLKRTTPEPTSAVTPPKTDTQT